MNYSLIDKLHLLGNRTLTSPYWEGRHSGIDDCIAIIRQYQVAKASEQSETEKDCVEGCQKHKTCRDRYHQPVGSSTQIATEIIEGIWSRWYGKYHGDVDTDIMAGVLADAKHKIITALRKCDEEMERVKACEHIAEGDMEGNDWRVLRNICPSTMAVAALRDKYEALLKREISFVDALIEAKKIVKKKEIFKKFIDGTPLENDIAVWMAEFLVKGGKP